MTGVNWNPPRICGVSLVTLDGPFDVLNLNRRRENRALTVDLEATPCRCRCFFLVQDLGHNTVLISYPFTNGTLADLAHLPITAYCPLEYS